jgi:hypothetical protein
MKAASAIAEYLIPHALIALGLTGPRATTAAPARTVLRWIRRERKAEFKASDVLDAVARSVVPDMSTVDSALKFLENMGYVRMRAQSRTGRPGRPPSPTYDVNPLLHARMPPSGSGTSSMTGNASGRPSSITAASSRTR